MNSKTVWEKFLQFENENNTFSFSYNGVQYWHLIRNFEIYMDNVINSGTDNSGSSVIWTKKSFKERWNSLASMFFQLRYLLIPLPEDILLVSDDRIRVIGGKKKNQILFPLEEWEKYRKRYFNVDGFYCGHGIQEMNLSLLNVIMGFITLKVNLKYKLNRYCNEEIQDWVSRLNTEFHCQCSSRDIERIIDRYTSYYKIAVKYYKRSLKNFKAVVVVCHYEFQRMVLTAAAKKMKIPVIELQHGIMSEDHIAYNFCDNISAEYLPDVFLCYGRFWKEVCNFDRFVPMRVVGNPLFEYCTLEAQNDQKWENTLVLYSGSGAGKRLIRLAEEFLKSAAGKNFKVLFKCHPKENVNWKNIYPELVDSKIEVIADDYITVYDLFYRADFHMAGESTALYEAAACGKCAMYSQMSERDFGCFEKLISSGTIKPVYNLKQLEEIIEHNKEKPAEELDVNYIFERNSQQKIRNVVEEFIVNETK